MCCDVVDFGCLCEDDFVGVVEGLYGRVVGGEGFVFRVFGVSGGFLYVVVCDDVVGGDFVASVFFEEFSWDLICEWVGFGVGCLGGEGGLWGGVCDCFRFRGVFVGLLVVDELLEVDVLRCLF